LPQEDRDQKLEAADLALEVVSLAFTRYRRGSAHLCSAVPQSQ